MRSNISIGGNGNLALPGPNISPRPLLLLHSSTDSVTPTEQSLRLFQRAGKPCDLHLFSETDHFMFHEDNVRVMQVLRPWLHEFFPVKVA